MPLKRLRELDEFFRLSLDLLAIADFEGRFRMVSDAWERILGFHKEELLAKPFIELVHPEDRDATMREAARLASGDVSVAFENRYRTRQGAYRTLRWHASSSVANGRVYAAARDVTDERVQQMRLRLAQQLTAGVANAEDVCGALQVILEGCVQNIRWDLGEAWRRRGDHLEASPSWYAATAELQAFRESSSRCRFGAGEGLPGHAWEAGCPVWIRDVTKDPAYQRAELGRRFGLRSALAVPVKDRDEVVAVAVFYSRDDRQRDPELEDLLQAVSSQVGAIVRRKEAEEARLWLAALVQSTDDAVIGCRSDDFRIVSFNPAAERMFGVRAGEVEGRTLPEALGSGSEAIATLVRTVRGVVASGASEQTSLRFRGRYLATAVSPVRRPGGEVLGASIVAYDETEQYLMAERLRAAQRMASLGTLSSGVAHEVNNPLTSVISNLDVAIREIQELAGGSPASRLRDLEEVLSEARLGADRVRRIVRGLSAFSEPGREGELALLDLPRVVDMAVRMARNEVRHRARIVRDYREVPRVAGDETRLAQLFVNLLANAARAIPAGDPAANEVRVRTYTDADGRAVAEVEDTGEGIAEEDLPRLFDPFFTTKEVGAGTGLGLAICHGIAATHAGELQVESEIGRGSTFRLVLPSAQAGPSPALSIRPVAASSLPPRGPRVLLVDDDPLVARAFVRILSRSYQVETVNSGPEALGRLRAGEAFDVILCDMSMPDMDGQAVYRAVADTRPDLTSAFVFVTGGAVTPEGHRFLAGVGRPRLQKPVDPVDLRDAVARVAAEREPPSSN